MEIYEFIRLSKAKRKLLLKQEGLLLEKYEDGKTTVYVYYLDGFFVEETYNKEKLIDSIPYKRGYKLNKQELHALVKKNLLFHLAA